MAEQLPPTAVAIVGLACRFPGARGPAAYWSNLRGGVESIRRLADAELLAAGVERSLLDSPRYVKAAAVLEGADLFDAPFFGFSPRQALLTDPQQRLFLECVSEALDDAGFAPGHLRGPVGVYAGASLSHYLLALLSHTQAVAGAPDSLQAYLGNDKDYVATQASYRLDLRGPSLSVQTACSTSLVAVHLACQALLGGECELALAGASVVRVPQTVGYLSEDESIFSPDGHCRPFDARARGTLFGSGVGVVALKRLERALADGDRIRAVVRGTAINNDGTQKVAFHAPSPDGQAAVIAEALLLAGVEPDTLSYVEAHGTGTLLGDPIEVAALTSVFRQSTRRRGFCALGSVKSNLGHLENAAGMAGLIKTVLSFEQQQLPASLHFETPNPHINFDDSPFRVNAALRPWPRGAAPRRAGVSAFGMGGTNAHVVLEEAPLALPRPARRAAGAALLPLSARSPRALRELAARYEAWLPTSAADPVDLAYAASVRRRHHLHRATVVGRTREELAEQLRALARADIEVEPAAQAAPKLAFVFPGQGSQWLGMGRELLEAEPAFREAIERCDRALHAHQTGWTLRGQLAGREPSRLAELDVVQPTLFAMQVALAELWRAWGVMPDVVVGHSMGEVAAAHVAGALGLDDAARVIALRSRLARRVRGRGAMGVVGLSFDEAREALRGRERELSVAASSSPRSTVISGDAAALEALLTSLQERNVFVGRVKVDFASHSPQVDPLLAELRQLLAGVRPRPGAVPLFSTVDGALVDGSGYDATYWARNLREPVLFAAAVDHLSARGPVTFLEVSAHPILAAAIEQSLAHHGRRGAALSSLVRERPERAAMLASLGALYALGHPVDWARLHPEGGAWAELPAYPWQHERYWPDDEGRSGVNPVTAAHPLLGRRVPSPSAEVQFERRWSERSPAFVAEHRVADAPVAPGAALAVVALLAARELYGTAHVSLELEELLALREGARSVHFVATPEGPGRAAFRIASAAAAEPNAWAFHASGRLSAGAPIAAGATPAAPAAGAEQGTPLDGPALAALIEGSGVSLGPSMRWVERAWLREGEALGHLRAPGGADTFAEVGWIDACFQLVGLAAGGAGALETGALYLPVRVGELQLREGADPPRRVRAVARAGAGGAGELVGDAELWDETSRLVGTARGVAVRRVNRAMIERAVGGAADTWLHEVVWRPIEAPPAPPETTRGRWLLVGDEGPLARALARALRDRGDACTLASPGGATERVDVGRWRVALREPGELAKVLSEGANGAPPWRGALLLRAGGGAGEGRADDERAAASEHACAELLYVVQALASLADTPKLWVVTRGAQAVGSGPIAVAEAALWGLGRTVAQEHPELWGGLVDLDPHTELERAALELLAAVQTPGGEDQLAWRDGRRLAPRLVRATEARAADAPLRLRDDATYLITGGFGGLGRAVANHFLARGARHLVLLGRRGGTFDLPGDLGAKVLSLQVDVADGAALTRALDEVARSMPPLRGLVHAAGVLDDGVLVRQDAARLARALAPKAGGALHLDRLTRALPLDFFVLFSSSAALLGPAGQGGYAAANALLDALAHERAGQGLPATAIDWSAWADVGLAAAFADEARRQGIEPLSSEQGLRALEAAMALGRPQIGVLPVQWARYVRARGRALPLLGELAPTDAAAFGPPALVRRLGEMPPARRRAALVAHVRALAASLLGLASPETLAPDAGFFGAGMDSLRVIELKNRLQADLGRALTAGVVFNHATAEALGAYLDGAAFGAERPAPTPALAAPTPDGLEATIDELSEDEVEALLLSRLAALDDSNNA
ncbi:MAG: type I polyketide synthase [Polyangiaceae bacterium]|nr:type I polyketide synthase [Polyangiaceae bacterium]